MIKIIKKDKTIQPFDIEKVISAVNKSAFRVMYKFSEDEIIHIKLFVESVANNKNNWEKEEDNIGYITVPMMHNIVEKCLSDIAPSVAQSYRDYRNYKTSFVEILDSVYKKSQAIMYIGDKENANSDSTLVSTKRSLIFGQLNKELYQKFQLSTKVLQACRDGYIYVHDMSSRRDCVNCFRRDTKFITKSGVKSFYDFTDGDETIVLTHKGNWKKAVVHKYGRQKLQKVTFVQATGKSRRHEIYVTPDHRWILQDGTETTNLSVGDKLIPVPDVSSYNWDELSHENKKIWCKGFALGDGSVNGSHGGNNHKIQPYVTVRLCGDKLKRYRDRFEECGYIVHEPESLNGDGIVHMFDLSNKDIPFFDLDYTNLKYYISGFVCADGHRRSALNPISEFKGIQITGEMNKYVNDMFHISGYFITSSKDITGSTTNYGVRNKETISYRFTTNQEHISNWKVESIEPATLNPKAEVWCLEVEDDHSFILEGGIPTGNCCLADVENVLNGGFEMGNIWYNEPKSLDVAFDVIGDIILSAAAQQYGGFTVPRIDEILIKYANKSYNMHFNKHFKSKMRSIMSVMGYTSEDEVYHSFKTNIEKEAHEEAMEDVRKEMEQGFQGLEIKLNTVASSRGDYPFTTFTIGVSTDPFASLAAEVCLEVRAKGQGAPGKKKSVLFPKLVFTYTEDLHGEGKELNWLFEKALDCSLKAMYPDFLSLDGDTTIAEMWHKFGEIIAPMGCVEGNEIVTYKYKGELFVESIRRMWERIGKDYPSKKQRKGEPHLYLDPNEVQIYDSKNGFVNVKRMVMNVSTDWMRITMSNGRTIQCTSDHPFPVVGKGRTHARDLMLDDVIPLIKTQYSEETEYVDPDYAYMLGVLICDSSKISKELTTLFEGIRKSERKIPDIIFRANREAKLAFLAGMIDADGYINSTNPVSIIQIGSTNKELALGQMALMQSLGIRSTVYCNHYQKGSNKIRYRVEGDMTNELLDYVQCEKKKKHFENSIRSKNSHALADTGYITKIEYLDTVDFSYDVTTESDYFDVSGIYSHNCRAFLSPYYDRGGVTPADEDDKPFFTGRFNIGVVSLNLPMIYAKANQENIDFYEVLDEYLELAREVHIMTYNYLANMRASTNPVMFCQGGFHDGYLDPNDKIKPLLRYATASFGITALNELNRIHNGKSIREDGQFPLEVMEYINKKAKEFKAEDHINYAIYGTPAESLCGTQVTQFRLKYGIVENVSDREYVSNSFHCHVSEEMDGIEKQDKEFRFWELFQGGRIQYVKYDINYNKDAVRSYVKRAMKMGLYEGINFTLCYCDDCGKESVGIDTCPKCGSNNLTKIERMNGYLSYSRVHGDTRLNSAKMAEIADRKSM